MTSLTRVERHARTTVTWGILGASAVAREFAEGLRAVPGASIAAVCSRRHDRAAAFARRIGSARSYDRYDTFLRDDELDVIYIASPNHLHASHTIAALEAGKAVLCEKPFALNSAEARDVISRARHHRRFCMEAMWMRFLPAMQKARAIVRNGDLGEIQLIQGSLGAAMRYDPSSRLWDPQMGGGALLDLGVYLVSLAFFLLGPPRHASGAASIGRSGVDQESVAVLSYAGGALAVLTASLRSELPAEALIVGTRGHLRIHAPLYRPHRLSLRRSVPASSYADDLSAPSASGSWMSRGPLVRWAAFKASHVRDLIGELRSKSVLVPFTGNGYNYEAEDVTRAVLAGEQESAVMPLDETLGILECLDAIRASWQTQT